MALHLFRDQFGLRPTSSKAMVPDNDLARLMYYLNCVFTVIEYKDQDVRRLRDYHNWRSLTDGERRMVLWFAMVFTPKEFDDQVFFQSDELCGDSSNKFYEFSQVRHQLLAVQSILVAGQTRHVTKIMTYRTSWMQRNYYDSIEGLKSYFNQQRVQEEARRQQALASRAGSAQPIYLYTIPQSEACVIS